MRRQGSGPRRPAHIDILVVDTIARGVLLGERKWRKSFGETAETVEKLLGRAALLV